MMKLFQHAGKDVPASLVVFLVAVPLCLGVALGSNAPVLSGLIAGIVGGIVVGVFSGSPLSVSGPAAGLITTVAFILNNLKDPATGQPVFSAFLLAVVLAGFIQILLGLIKAGKIADFIPVSVLKGMLAAIGIMLIFKQLPHLVGYDVDFEGDEEFFQRDGRNTFSEIEAAILNMTPLAMVIGVLGLAIQWFWDSVWFPLKKYKFLIPAPLVVVILAVVLNLVLEPLGFVIKAEHMVQLPVISGISQVGTLLQHPDLSYLNRPEVWKAAVEIAIIASLESLLSVQAIDKLDPMKRSTPANRELIAQGIGNATSGLLGGLPVTSVIVRSSANVNAGGVSKLSTILHGLILTCSLLFFPSLLNEIPLCALASILIYTGFKLASPALFRDHWKKGLLVFIPFLITVVAILFTDLLIGIGIGLLVGLFFVLRSNFKISIRSAKIDNQHLIKFSNQVSFLNKTLLHSMLNEVNQGDAVTIDLSACHFLDFDIREMLNDFIRRAELDQIKLEFRYLNDRQKQTLLL